MGLVKYILILMLLTIPLVFSQSVSTINVYELTINNFNNINQRCIDLGINENNFPDARITMNNEVPLERQQEFEQWIVDGCPETVTIRPEEPSKNIISRQITL